VDRAQPKKREKGHELSNLRLEKKKEHDPIFSRWGWWRRRSVEKRREDSPVIMLAFKPKGGRKGGGEKTLPCKGEKKRGTKCKSTDIRKNFCRRGEVGRGTFLRRKSCRTISGRQAHSQWKVNRREKGLALARKWKKKDNLTRGEEKEPSRNPWLRDQV